MKIGREKKGACWQYYFLKQLPKPGAWTVDKKVETPGATAVVDPGASEPPDHAQAESDPLRTYPDCAEGVWGFALWMRLTSRFFFTHQTSCSN